MLLLLYQTSYFLWVKLLEIRKRGKMSRSTLDYPSKFRMRYDDSRPQICNWWLEYGYRFSDGFIQLSHLAQDYPSEPKTRCLTVDSIAHLIRALEQ